MVSRESMTPLPICVVQYGMLVVSTKCRSILLVILRLAPAPSTSSGWLAACRGQQQNDTAQQQQQQWPDPGQDLTTHFNLECRQ